MASEIVYVYIAWYTEPRNALHEIKVFKNAQAAYDYKEYINRTNADVYCEVYPKVTED